MLNQKGKGIEEAEEVGESLLVPVDFDRTRLERLVHRDLLELNVVERVLGQGELGVRLSTAKQAPEKAAAPARLEVIELGIVAGPERAGCSLTITSPRFR